jgi:hypothetical protein
MVCPKWVTFNKSEMIILEYQIKWEFSGISYWLILKSEFFIFMSKILYYDRLILKSLK